MHNNPNGTDSHTTLEDDPEKVARRISHDIRTAVHGLIGYVEILRQELEPELEPAHLEMLKRIRVYSEQVIELVYQLMSRFEKE